MEPVRIKVYGLIRMTRQAYLIIQSVVLVFIVGFLATGILAMISAGTILPQLPLKDGKPGQEFDLLVQALGLLFWIGLITLIGESIETVWVLRKFAQAEVEQRARLAARDASGLPSAAHPSGVQPPPDARPNTNIQT